MSAVRTRDLLHAYDRWAAQNEGGFMQRHSANGFVDLWSKAPGPVKVWAALRMAWRESREADVVAGEDA